MRTTFIYGLFDPRNNQLRYIGKANNPKNRLKEHIRELKRTNSPNTHKNKWIKSLLSVDLYPLLEILEKVSLDNWEECETKWIERAKKAGCNLVNSTFGGEGVKCQNLTEEHKQKLSESHKGKTPWNKGIPHTIETKTKMSQSHKGHSVSTETKLKISAGNKKPKNYIMIDEAKEKLRQRMLGNKYTLGYNHTKEACEKISKTHKGKFVSEETRKKLSISLKGRVPHNKGKQHSPETRKKISEANKRYYENKRRLEE